MSWAQRPAWRNRRSRARFGSESALRPLMTNDDHNGSSGQAIVRDRPASPRPGDDRLARGTRGLSTARAVLKVLTFMASHPEGVSAREGAGGLGKRVSA